MRKKHLLKIIFTCLLSGLLLLLTACNESTRVSELLETGNYSEAVEKYNSLDRPDENLSEEFKLQLQKIYEKFKMGISIMTKQKIKQKSFLEVIMRV